jgi:hypothetical protein
MQDAQGEPEGPVDDLDLTELEPHPELLGASDPPDEDDSLVPREAG